MTKSGGVDLAALAKPMTKKAAPEPAKPKKAAAKAKPKRPAPKADAGESWAETNKRGNVYLPPELRAAATTHAEGLGLSFSAYVRSLIEADLAQ